MADRLPDWAQLTGRFDGALAYAAEVHREQARKETTIPYVGHLLGVASLVIGDGGDEDEAIAALLHDAVEDQGGKPRLADILARFGDRVADIVRGCGDSEATDPAEKLDWDVRKKTYLEHLPHASPEVLRVSCADKLHNARAILADYRDLGESLWSRFDPKAGRDNILSYYRSLVDVFKRHGPASLAAELDRVVLALGHLVTRTAGRHARATEEQARVMAPFGRTLDDSSADFLPHLRAVGVLSDTDWHHILKEVPEALHFLGQPDRTLTRDEAGQLVLDPDADPRNANWIRIVAAHRKAGHRLPNWAAMWLMAVGAHDRGPEFWSSVARVARQMGYPKREETAGSDVGKPG